MLKFSVGGALWDFYQGKRVPLAQAETREDKPMIIPVQTQTWFDDGVE